MKLDTARSIITAELKAAGVNGWRVRFVKVTSYMGMCCYNENLLKFSTYLFDCPDAEIIDTIRHEIAHIIAGYDAAHGPAWKKIAKKLGCSNIRACSDSAHFDHATLKAAKYVVAWKKTNKVVRAYFRKPSPRTVAAWTTGGASGRPETEGELHVVPYNKNLHIEME